MFGYSVLLVDAAPPNYTQFCHSGVKPYKYRTLQYYTLVPFSYIDFVLRKLKHFGFIIDLNWDYYGIC
jgi:hypothetical protein